MQSNSSNLFYYRYVKNFPYSVEMILLISLLNKQISEAVLRMVSVQPLSVHFAKQKNSLFLHEVRRSIRNTDQKNHVVVVLQSYCYEGGNKKGSNVYVGFKIHAFTPFFERFPSTWSGNCHLLSIHSYKKLTSFILLPSANSFLCFSSDTFFLRVRVR